MIAEFKLRYHPFITNDSFHAVKWGTWTESESDPLGDFMRFKDLMQITGRNFGKSFMSLQTIKLLYGEHFGFAWYAPLTDWEIYVQGNERLRKWRLTLSRRAAQKAMRLALKNSKPIRDKQWRAEERRRSRQRMPGR